MPRALFLDCAHQKSKCDREKDREGEPENEEKKLQWCQYETWIQIVYHLYNHFPSNYSFFASRRMACVSRMWKRARTFTHVKWCVMRTQAKTWYWLGITLAHRIGGRKWWKKAHRKYTQWKMSLHRLFSFFLCYFLLSSFRHHTH